MARVPIHFMGLLANVDDSITRVRLPDGVIVEKKPCNEVSSFVDRIEFLHGFTAALHSRLRAPTGYFCITKPAVCEFEGVAGVSVIQQPFALMNGFADVPRNLLRLLRLFKEGNPIIDCGFLCYEKNLGVGITNVGVEYPIADNGFFTLTDSGIPEAQSFIDTVSLPLPGSLELAFKSFELSYEVHDRALAFLSLMISMESMLGPNSPGELTHQVSRNAAVLLGATRSESQEVYRNVKSLYAKRSAIVHGGKGNLTPEDVLTLREHVRKTLRELHAMAISDKKQVQETLNPCGFGERPWKKSE